MEGLARAGRRRLGFATDTAADQVDKKRTTEQMRIGGWGGGVFVPNTFILNIIEALKLFKIPFKKVLMVLNDTRLSLRHSSLDIKVTHCFLVFKMH